MTGKTNDGYYEAYWPRGPRQQRERLLAPRLATLEGKTVAQLWDQLFKGDVVFEVLEESLKARFPGVKFVSWREFGSTHGADEKEATAPRPIRVLFRTISSPMKMAMDTSSMNILYAG